jgi:general stress protein 26
MSDVHENDPAVVWEVVRKVGISMLVTRDAERLEGRPLQAYPDPDSGLILYMTDSEHVLDQIAADARVLLSFADKGGNNFAAIDGVAAISNDRAKIKQLWTVWAEAFWDSPDDPSIRIIAVTPDHARYWDAPNALVTTIAMVAGVVTGKQPKLGKAGEVEM